MSSEPKLNRLFTVHFVKERKTKGTVRYTEVVSDTDSTPVKIEDGARICTLYIRKSALGSRHPKRLSVRVSERRI
jgi:hypothetical protein